MPTSASHFLRYIEELSTNIGEIIPEYPRPKRNRRMVWVEGEYLAMDASLALGLPT